MSIAYVLLLINLRSKNPFVTQFNDGRREMRHASIIKRKNIKKPYDLESYSERREHTIASSAYRQAKQRGFFETGEDVLRSLDMDLYDDDALTGVSHRRTNHMNLM